MGREKISKFIFLFQSFMIIFCFPVLEYPDSSHYIKHLKLGTSELYYSFVRFFMGKFINFNNVIIENNKEYKGMISNSLMYVDKGNQLIACQVFNVILVVLVILLLKKQLKKEKYLYEATLLYICWPQINFYLLNITTDWIVYLYTPFFIYLLIKEKHFLNLFICLIIYKFIDNNTITNLWFILVFIIFKKINMLSIKRFVLILVTGIIFFLIAKNFMSCIPIFNKFKYALEINKSLDSRYFYKMVAFFLGSIFLGGHGNIILFPLIYPLCYFYESKILYSNYKKILLNKKDTLLVFSAIFTIVTIITTIPNYAQIKYYTYFIFIVIYIFSRYAEKDFYKLFYFLIIVFNINLVYFKFIF